MPYISGCTDPAAFNYRPAANVDDSSCFYPVVGCMDAANFLDVDPLATIPDASACTVPIVRGCIDSTAPNWQPAANVDDGSCQVLGCTDASASNFDTRPDVNDDSCFYHIAGCMDSSASNYRADATTPAECRKGGCMSTASVAYDPDATFDDGYSCKLAVEGCTTAGADNYWESATHSREDSCIWGGCQRATATNYNPTASYDNGACFDACVNSCRALGGAALNDGACDDGGSGRSTEIEVATWPPHDALLRAHAACARSLPSP